MSTALPVRPTQIGEIFPEDICWQITHVVAVIIIARREHPLVPFFTPSSLLFSSTPQLSHDGNILMDAKEFHVSIFRLSNAPLWRGSPLKLRQRNLSEWSEGNKRFPAVHRFAQISPEMQTAVYLLNRPQRSLHSPAGFSLCAEQPSATLQYMHTLAHTHMRSYLQGVPALLFGPGLIRIDSANFNGGAVCVSVRLSLLISGSLGVPSAAKR